MLIKNTTTSIISLPGVDGEAHGRLLPGMNDVKAADWKAAEPSMALHLERGAVEVVEVDSEEPGQPGSTSDAASVATMAQKVALKLIAETFDRDLLKRWESEESEANKRPKVLAAISAQLEAVALKKPSSTVELTDDEAEALEEA